MSNQSSFSQISKKNILPIFFAVILVFILCALFTGNSYDDQHAELSASGSMQKGVFVSSEWADIEVAQINRDIAREYNLSPGTKGVIITELDGNRDVLMKLRKGDVITGINGRKIDNLRDFRKASKYVNPTEGMILDIQRNGYPMYISISGAGSASGSQPVELQNPHPFSMTEVAPFLGKDIDVGGMNFEAGIIGKEIEKWIESNFGSGFYACQKCGTLVPNNVNSNNGSIFCPNCGTKMVLK